MPATMTQPQVDTLMSLGRIEGALWAAIFEAVDSLSPGHEECLDLCRRSVRVQVLFSGCYQATLYISDQKSPDTAIEMDCVSTPEAMTSIAYGWLVFGQLGII